MSTGSTKTESGAARFSRHIIWTLGARVLIAGGSIVAGVLIARWLGAAAVGIVASLSVMTVLAVTFGGLGMPSAITYLVARDPSRAPGIMVNAVGLSMVLGGIIVAATIGLLTLRPDLFGDISSDLVMIAAIAIPFHLLIAFCLAILLGRGDLVPYNLVDIFSQAFLVINPVITLGLLGLGLFALVSLQAAISIMFGLLVAGFLFRTLVLPAGESSLHFDKAAMTEMFRAGSKFYITMLGAVILFRADLLLVNYLRGAAEAGVYAIAAQVGTLVMLIPGVISTVLFPRVTAVRDTGEMTCRVTRHTSLIMLVVCCLVVPAAFLLPILYGPAFAEVPLLVMILLPGVYLIGLESVQVQYFSSLGLPRAIPVFWACAVVVNLALNLALVPSYGAVAAAAVSSGSYALMFALVAYYFRSRTGRSFAEAFFIRGPEVREFLHIGKPLATGASGPNG